VHVCFAQQDGAGVKQLLQHGRVALGAVSRQAGRAAGGGRIGAVEVVLDGERHAVQRPEPLTALALGVGPPGGGAHRVGIEAYEGVERSSRGAPRKQRFGQRLCRDLACADCRGCVPDTKLSECNHLATRGFARYCQAEYARVVAVGAIGAYDRSEVSLYLPLGPRGAGRRHFKEGEHHIPRTAPRSRRIARHVQQCIMSAG
jgi:hypothetical protein